MNGRPGASGAGPAAAAERPLPPVTRFRDVLSMVRPDGQPSTLTRPADWTMGRTMAGGLSAALCLTAARSALDVELPLRSAQLSFAGPVGEAIALTPTLLRADRREAVVGVELVADGAVAVTGTFFFGAARDAVAYDDLRCPAAPPPERCPPFQPPPLSTFKQQFDMRLIGGARPRGAATDAAYTIWIRHRDPAADTMTAGLLALADAPPPPAETLYDEARPIATLTWTANVLDPPRDTGWRIMRARSRHVRDGFSSHVSTVWDAAGRPLMTSLQGVAAYL